MKIKFFMPMVTTLVLLGTSAQAQSGRVITTASQDSPVTVVQTDNGAYLGAYLADVKSEERARELKLAEVRGAIVGRVVQGSPASKAGLKENDVILAFDGEVVRSALHLHRLLRETPAGRTVKLQISRAGVKQELTATLSEWSFGMFGGGQVIQVPDKIPQINDDVKKMLEQNSRAFNGGDIFYQDLGQNRYRLGVRVTALGEQLAKYFGVKEDNGLLVTEVEPNSLAERAGLKAGDCITMVNGERVSSANDLSNVVRRAGKAAEKNPSAAEPLTLTIVRDRKEQTIKVKPEERK
ncbi:MAG TPA: PDZ domain-containing protein [Blastocatellia bacterium]|nr:PDZ domain-containing protein [Blastocatellia bacterium]